MTIDDARVHEVLALALERDPSIEQRAGALLARACLEVMADEPASDPAPLARRCLARYPDADPSWVAHLARAALTTTTG